MIVNTEQAEAWNGYEGSHWAGNHDRYDAINSGFNELVLDAARIGEGDRVLDIGCGNGQLTRLAAGRTRSGGAVGVDLSEPMLARARSVAASEGVANVTFERGDVQVHPFPAGQFDAVVSRFAVMYYADPVAAFANVARAMRPGGRLAFVTMKDLAGTDMGAVLAALAPYVPGWTSVHDPDDSGSGPQSLADPDHVHEVLAEAGFRDIAVAHAEADSIWGDDAVDAAAFFAGWGPVRYHLGDADPAPARASLAAAFRPFEGPGGVCLRGTAWLVTAAR